MADGLMMNGAGAADLDAVTAAADDILKGKVIVDRDGNPLTGTLALTGSVTAADIRKGKTGYAADPKSKITGTMAEQGGSTTTPGTANKTVVSANKYVTGSIVVAGDKNLVAANIIKGKTIFGVAGSAIYAGDEPGYFLQPPKEYEELTGGWDFRYANTSRDSFSESTLERAVSMYKIRFVGRRDQDGGSGYVSSYIYTVKDIDYSKYRYIYIDYQDAYDAKSAGSTDTGDVYIFADAVSSETKTKLEIGSANKKSGTLKSDVSNLSNTYEVRVGVKVYVHGYTSFSIDVRANIKAIRYAQIQ